MSEATISQIMILGSTLYDINNWNSGINKVSRMRRMSEKFVKARSTLHHNAWKKYYGIEYMVIYVISQAL